MSGSSQPLRIVIVGGVAGGATAAARARRANAQAEIILLEKGPAVSFANCGLPYHLGGEITERKKLLVATPELFDKRFQVDVRTTSEVIAIDRAARTVTVVNLQTQATYQLHYDRLILATGSEPLRPDFWTSGVRNVFQLWNLNDLDAVLAMMRERQPQTAAVIGAGFIGLEVVEQLHRLGIDVSLIERNPHVLKPLDADMAAPIAEEIKKQGVQLYLNAGVEKMITAGDRAVALQLQDGRRVESDIVIVGIGVRPRVELAHAAGLAIGKQGGVTVNAWMQTSDPLIYAVGDMTELPHGVLESPQRIPLAGSANRGGRIAGTHAATGQAANMGVVLGTSIVRVFNLVAASTGINEQTCQSAGFDYRTAIIQAADHATYYPNAHEMILKILYAPDSGRLLGAQIVGESGVDKRIDILATTLHFRGTIHDLAQLDLAYAPPFGAAKDPVNMIAFVAQNDLAEHPTLLPAAAALAGWQVVDVRTAAETQALPLAGAKHIPIDELSLRWQELDPSQPTVVVCHSGKRAHIGACWLSGHGFAKVRNLTGGMSMRRHALSH